MQRRYGRLNPATPRLSSDLRSPTGGGVARCHLRGGDAPTDAEAAKQSRRQGGAVALEEVGRSGRRGRGHEQIAEQTAGRVRIRAVVYQIVDPEQPAEPGPDAMAQESTEDLVADAGARARDLFVCGEQPRRIHEVDGIIVDVRV